MSQPFFIPTKDEQSFNEACKKGDFSEAYKLYKIVNNNLKEHLKNFSDMPSIAEKLSKNFSNLINNSFMAACFKGHLHIAIWLYYLDSININTSFINSSFLLACKQGYFDIAEWLYSIDKNIDLNKYNFTPFIYACYHGNIEFAKWLDSFNDKPDLNIIKKAHKMAIENDKLDVALWLWTLNKKNNIRENNDYIFKKICEDKNIKLIKLLCELCSDYFVEYDDYDNIKSWKVKTDIDYLYEKKDYDKLIEKFKIIKVYFTDNQKYKDNRCIICHSNNYNFLTSCDHAFCLDCFLQYYIEYNKKKCCVCNRTIKLDECCYQS